MSKKPTLKDRYNKQINRISKAYSNLMEQPGTIVNVSLGDIIGKAPSRLSSKYIEKLEKITPSKIRAYSSFYDIYTGEKISYNDWRTMINNPSVQNEEQSEIVAFNTSIYEQLISAIDDLPNIIYTYSQDGHEVWVRPLDNTIKEDLTSIVRDKWSSDDNGEYAQYLENNMDAITKALEMLKVEGMYNDAYLGGISTLYYYINGGEITVSQQERSAIYNEARETYQGEDDED